MQVYVRLDYVLNPSLCESLIPFPWPTKLVRRPTYNPEILETSAKKIQKVTLKTDLRLSICVKVM